MRTMVYLSILVILASLAGCNQAPRVLLVVGGHAYDTTEFYDMFRELEPIEFDSVSHPQAMDLLASDQVDNYDVLLFYDFLPDMSLRDSSIFLELTSKGLPLLFMHHSLGNFQEWEGYAQIAGGKYVMPGFGDDSASLSDYAHDIDLEVEVLDAGHPVAAGISTFHIHDEGYTNIQVNRDIHPLFGTSHPQCAPLMGWTKEFQNSTTVYLMFGHDRLAYENESLHQILVNSIQWLSEQ
jgi:hypothetical protein